MSQGARERNVAHLHPFDPAQDAGPHGDLRSVRRDRLFPGFDRSAQTILPRAASISAVMSLVSRRPAACNAVNRCIVLGMPVSNDVDGKSPITLLMDASSSAGAIGMGGPSNVTSCRPAWSW